MSHQLEPADYQDGDVICKGRLVLPSGTDARPGIVVFPDIFGISDLSEPGDHPIDRAIRLADELGYVALVADVYGEGAPPPFPDAVDVVASWLANPEKIARRAAAAVEALKAHPRCDGRVAAIGFCFGGGVVMALVRSGADLVAGVTFHGVLATPKPALSGMVKAKLLVLHGGDDYGGTGGTGELAFGGEGGDLKSATVIEFMQEMSAANIDCQMISYSGVVHAFTIAARDALGIPGVKYDAVADRRSWQAMVTFFEEIF
ncbi:dienelactone hydrolase family protein [Sphingobium sp. HWE2-09]|uniref:dienelactone hydrolase family protein n=1 Tax=Sphingobium sp. HWE2-09 TaxID=3108390 RepID=UPI002DD10F43|nr:dienelactone hydrolase family protein [Sphingobium sp. HWE2-09]